MSPVIASQSTQLEEGRMVPQPSHDCGHSTWFDRAWVGLVGLCGLGSVLLAIEVAVTIGQS